MESYKLQVRLINLMKINTKKLKDIGIVTGSIIGYITILIGIIMTILLLVIIFSGEYI